VLIDIRRDRAEDLMRRLRPFKLRADVQFADVTGDWAVIQATDPFEGLPDGAQQAPDPRAPGFAHRALIPAAWAPETAGDAAAWQSRRIAHGVPEATEDLIVDRSLLLEANVDRLGGIDWQKGCFMGQELTARTRYRALIKRRLIPVRAEADLVPGTELQDPDGRAVGSLTSTAGGWGLAHLRLDAMDGPLSVDGIPVTLSPPDWQRPVLDEDRERLAAKAS